MDLQQMRSEAHRTYVAKKRLEYLCEKIGAMITLDEYDRKLHIISSFFTKYYIQPYRNAIIISRQHTRINAIPGLYRCHYIYNNASYVCDLREYAYIVDLLPSDLARISLAAQRVDENTFRGLRYIQNFEYNKSLAMDRDFSLFTAYYRERLASMPKHVAHKKLSIPIIQRMPVIPTGICHGTTKTGNACHYRAKIDNYCMRHLPKK